AGRVGGAQEAVALAGREHAERHAEVPGRRLDDDRPREQHAVPLGAVHHLGRGLQLDRACEVETLALQEEALPHDRPEVDVERILGEAVRMGDDRHGGLLTACPADQPDRRGSWKNSSPPSGVWDEDDIGPPVHPSNAPSSGRAGARSGSRCAPSSRRPARSASTGWRTMSFSDTARSSTTTSFTADSDVPPRSKKSSCRPTSSGATPSTPAQAAASRRSVGVRGASRSWAHASCPASAVSALLSILPLPVTGSSARQWTTDGTMYS